MRTETKKICHLTIKQFLDANFTSQTMRQLVGKAFVEIRKDRLNLFSEVNRGWTMREAREKLSRHFIAIASDHAGFHAKMAVNKILEALKVRYDDLGPWEKPESPLDYPIQASETLSEVKNREYSRGILVCGSGTGMQIVANYFPGIRAAKTLSPKDTVRAREHNDLNVLTIGERLVGENEFKIKDLIKCVILFLTADFIADPGRYQKRINLNDEIHLLAVKAHIKNIPHLTDLPEFTEHVARCPEIADLLVKRGDHLLKAGNTLGAVFYYERYLNLGKDSQNFNRFIEEIKEQLKGFGEEAAKTFLAQLAVPVAGNLIVR